MYVGGDLVGDGGGVEEGFEGGVLGGVDVGVFEIEGVD